MLAFFTCLALAAGTDPDSVDLIVTSESESVRIRLDFDLHGKSLHAQWQEYMTALFADLDVNADGMLQEKEAARVPSAAILDLLLRGEAESISDQLAAPWPDLDLNRDKAVSKAELTAYYHLQGLRPLLAQVVQPASNTRLASAGLFNYLDRNADQRLSRAELQQAAETLRKLDLDEDEWWTVDELSPALPDVPTAAKVTDLQATGLQVQWSSNASPSRQYLIRFGSKAAPPPALSLGRTSLTVEIDDRAISSFRSIRQFYLQEFEVADLDAQGVLTREQAGTSEFLKVILPLVDRNGDGSLSRKELTAFLDLHATGAAARVTMTVNLQSLGLFDHLDRDANGRLSQRELAGAWQRLAPFDHNGDMAMARDEMPRQLGLRFTQGYARPQLVKEPETPKARVERAGPRWFQLMDRNGDGDVSLREFLGPIQTFKALDRDGDNLLSPAEVSKRGD